MLGPLVFSNIFNFTKKNSYSKKRFPKKSLFHKKKNFTERKFEKYFAAKKMHKGHITGRRKNFKQKKSKLKVCHSYRRNSLNYTSETRFFFQFRFYMQSLPTANFSLV